MGAQGINGEQANWQVATGEGHKRSPLFPWVAEYKKECVRLYFAFSHLKHLGLMDWVASVFIFLISPGGDDSYYTAVAQWFM